MEERDHIYYLDEPATFPNLKLFAENLTDFRCIPRDLQPCPHVDIQLELDAPPIPLMSNTFGDVVIARPKAEGITCDNCPLVPRPTKP